MTLVYIILYSESSLTACSICAYSRYLHAFVSYQLRSRESSLHMTLDCIPHNCIKKVILNHIEPSYRGNL
ncbi:unnamed protein product [Chondrus crispus]|uniref:Uncharacterized protein n=1 Tax=Chondrus crispus TaxID=2769 RepID=R7QG30_CHOCR|nr:unnamed protein product [Chondrus crispus]CDF36733.1 unnamed protein product [Chondrus crispus]|eukprot:XP_005716552.1 unnamed protein product [Chondrus crispus]